MKTIMKMALLGIVATLMVACKPANQPRNFDGGAKLYVNVRNNVRSMNVEARALPVIEGDTQRVLTPREVVEQALNFIMTTEDGYKDASCTITESEMKDLENSRIKMRQDMIVDRFGNLKPGFMKSSDIRIVNVNSEIIAYIPQSVVKDAWTKIQEAYNAGDYDAVYQLFQDAYTAVPCTTKQWQALKEQGLQ